METHLTVLSYGAGQDSSCILYKLIYDREFKEKWQKGYLIVIMSDTGNEHPHTYEHIRFTRKICTENNIPFYFITADQGYHPRTWPTLPDQYTRNSSLMSVAFPKSCTDNLKIKPIYNFLDHYVAKKYFGYNSTEHPKGKKFLKLFAKVHGKINVILGIAYGEEKRIAKKNGFQSSQEMNQISLFDKNQNKNSQKWMNLSLSKSYPLIDEKMDRKACQDYISSLGLSVPYPSNCIMCPYISKIEIVWLYRNLPNEFEKWVQHEERKLDKNKNTAKRNLGVKGEKNLRQVLEESLLEFGNLTLDELNYHKMSHGHCVMSSY